MSDEQSPEQAESAVTFLGFVLSLAHTAAVHFGDVPDPVSGQTIPANLPAAQQMIDILALLEEKTRGNLTAEERQFLDQILYELRLRYVEASQQGSAPEPSRIIIIALAVFKPCVVNARAGMKEVAQIYVDAARTLGASRWRVFATVALPSAIPYFIAGMRTGVSTGFLALVAAELIAAPSGLGFMIQNAGQYFRTDVTIVGIIVIGILGAILDQIANRAGRRLTAWSDVRRDA